METLSFKEYKEIIQEDLKRYQKFYDKFKNFDDFDNLMKSMNIQPLPYFIYCEVHNKEPEMSEKEYYKMIGEIEEEEIETKEIERIQKEDDEINKLLDDE